MGIDAFPVDARAFHDDQFDIQIKKPARQGMAIAFETAELTALLFDGAVRMFNDGGDNVQHLMDIDAGNASVEWRQSFHVTLLWLK
nr:hypothetical protein [Paraburkholderia elongata]